MNKDKIKKQIQEYFTRQISLNLTVNEIESIRENEIIASLNYFIPKMIFDDAKQKQYIKFIKLNKVYNAPFKLNTNGLNPQFNKKYVYKKIEHSLLNHQKIIEDLILDKIYPNLVKIPLIKNQLSPIYTILLEILTNNKLAKGEISRMKKQDKLKKYLSFLVELEIIRRDKDGNYVEGNIPVSLKHDFQKLKGKKLVLEKFEEKILAHTFGYALKEGKKYLLEELRLTAVKPFLRLAVFYYNLACQIKSLNKLTRETFYDSYTSENPHIQIIPSQLNNQLQDMVNAGIFVKEGSYFVGESRILSALC